MRDLTRYLTATPDLTVKESLEAATTQMNMTHKPYHVRQGLEALEEVQQHTQHVPELQEKVNACMESFIEHMGVELEPSTEGLADKIRDVKARFGRGNKKKDIAKSPEKLYGTDFHKALDDLSTAIKRYYLNDSWLKRQRFSDVPVLGGGINEGLVLDDKVWIDPYRLWNDSIIRITKLSKAYTDAMVPYSKEINKIHAEVVQRHSRGDDLQTILKEAISKTTKVKQPEETIAIKSMSLLGNTYFFIEKGGTKAPFQVVTKPLPKGFETFPVLDVKHVKGYANLMLKIIEVLKGKDESTNFYMGRFPHHSDEEALSEDALRIDEELWNDYLDHVDIHTTSHLYDNPNVEIQEAMMRLLSALESWIDRSIK